ncbi:MAG: glutamate methylesterase [Moraxellaceae bacterium]|jgi:two-component system chemotaxis response regulator CheB|nr:glutamate methylesterase [Moraxellaceae bacterium]
MARKRASRPRVLPYDIAVIGASWGGVDVLMQLVKALPRDWQLPLVIVQHQHPNSGTALQRILRKLTSLEVRDVEDKDMIEPGHIYIAPANYHLMVENDRSFSLSIMAPVNYSRPSIDVTFDSLARVFQQRCIGIILTGANDDGAEGLRRIKAEGGYTLAQDPKTAEAPAMPQAAIATGAVDEVLPPAEIVPHLLTVLSTGKGSDAAEHSYR